MIPTRSLPRRCGRKDFYQFVYAIADNDGFALVPSGSSGRCLNLVSFR